MSNKDDYLAKIEAIRAIPDEKIKRSYMPIDIFLQEAEDLYHWSMDDQELLSTIGIDSEILNDLPVRCAACREAQSMWNTDRKTQKKAQQQWEEQLPHAIDFCTELKQTFRYAFRNNKDLLEHLMAINKGSSHSDMIQDLNDLAILGQSNLHLLEKISFDQAKLEQAASLSEQLASLLAKANGARITRYQSKENRDKAYAYLKELVDEIRNAGKYLFRKNKERHKGYTSSFWKNKNQRKKD